MSESADKTSNPHSPLERPSDLLAGVAAEAWQAYNAMETTKRRHFEWLEILENRKRNYNIDSSESDQRLLSALMQDHDEQVGRFTRASQALKSQSSTAHLALFTYIGLLSRFSDEQAAVH